MQVGNKYLMGYWPASLFVSLSESASQIQWGGEVINQQKNGQHTSTQMGSGHFPEEGFSRASYFKNLQIVDGSNILRFPKKSFIVAEKPNCYNVTNFVNYFYYGGPGKNPNCPWSFRLLFQIKGERGQNMKRILFSSSLHVTPNVPTSHMWSKTLWSIDKNKELFYVVKF